MDLHPFLDFLRSVLIHKFIEFKMLRFTERALKMQLILNKFSVSMLRDCYKYTYGRHHFCFFLFSQNWFAFSKLHKPLFTEHGVISFPNTNPPSDKMNNAYCEVRKEFFANLLA